MIEMEDIPITKEEYTTMVKTINQLRKEKQHLIDKACKWLFEYNKRQAKRFGAKSIMRLPDYTINVGDFRKAMEKQQ